jgi:hypothetical protein
VPADPPKRLFLGVADDEAAVADRLACGGLIGFGFGNFYALAGRPDVDAVRSANVMKGRPPDQVGSVVTTPICVPDAYDWSRLPAELTRDAVLNLMDVLFVLGPFGFRGPAADTIPDHLSQRDSGVRTTQVIAPGYGCPSNRFIGACLHRAGSRILFITSANRSHHVSAAREEPAHYRGDALAADFASGPELLLLRHRDEDAVRARHPMHAPMSTTLLAFHRTAGQDPHGRVRLIVERRGSLPVEEVERLVHPLGFCLVLGPGGGRRLSQRTYPA